MATIAGMQDFRQEGPPADIGTYQLPCSVMVFRHTFSGTNYICAIRSGERGWDLISFLPETDANTLTVINAAFAALTAARTHVETIITIGNYTVNGSLTPDSYTDWLIQGKITLAANSDVHMVSVDTETEIHIHGGHLDGNGANQGAVTDINTIHFDTVTHSSIYQIRLGGAHRNTTNGETIELTGTSNWINVHHCNMYVYAASYDHIKLTGTTTNCTIGPGNHLDGTAGTNSNAIQLIDVTVTDNTVIGNTIISPHASSWGIKCHRASDNFIISNNIPDCGFVAIGLLDEASNNFVFGNKMKNVEKGISIIATNGYTASFNTFQGNYIKLDGSVGAIGIDLRANATDTEVFENHIHGVDGVADTGISILAGATDNRLRDNRIYDCATDIADAGTTTQYGSGTMFIGGSYATLDPAATEYIVVSGKASPSANIDQETQLVAMHGTFKGFYVKLQGAPGAGNSYNFRFMLNGVAQSLQVTISGAAVSGSDLANEFEVNPGDEVVIRVTPADSPVAQYAWWASCFEPY